MNINYRGLKTPDALIAELIYASYALHRDTEPHISPEAWAKVLPNVPAMEARYQAEKNIPA